MNWIPLVLLVLALVALAATVARGSTDERRAAERGEFLVSLLRRHVVLSCLLGVAVALGLFLGIGIYLWVAAAIGAVAGVASSILLTFLEAQRLARLESQLADAIDLMVSTLRAGGGLTDAVATAARETAHPLRRHLEELLDRIRLGEVPEVVLTDLETRIPVEGFRLFALTLAAHWQGGGSLATTLSNVGRTIRDRVDVARRIRSQAVETQASVVGILIVTYGLALLMWNNYPERFTIFATSEIGAMFIGLSVFLQALGLLWISRLTRIEV